MCLKRIGSELQTQESNRYKNLTDIRQKSTCMAHFVARISKSGNTTIAWNGSACRETADFLLALLCGHPCDGFIRVFWFSQRGTQHVVRVTAHGNIVLYTRRLEWIPALVPERVLERIPERIVTFCLASVKFHILFSRG